MIRIQTCIAYVPELTKYTWCPKKMHSRVDLLILMHCVPKERNEREDSS